MRRTRSTALSLSLSGPRASGPGLRYFLAGAARPDGVVRGGQRASQLQGHGGSHGWSIRGLDEVCAARRWVENPQVESRGPLGHGDRGHARSFGVRKAGVCMVVLCRVLAGLGDYRCEIEGNEKARGRGGAGGALEAWSPLRHPGGCGFGVNNVGSESSVHFEVLLHVALLPETACNI